MTAVSMTVYSSVTPLQEILVFLSNVQFMEKVDITHRQRLHGNLFKYLPIAPWIKRMFGNKTVSKLLQSHLGTHSTTFPYFPYSTCYMANTAL